MAPFNHPAPKKTRSHEDGSLKSARFISQGAKEITQMHSANFQPQ
jgi:hypothetical protein